MFTSRSRVSLSIKTRRRQFVDTRHGHHLCLPYPIRRHAPRSWSVSTGRACVSHCDVSVRQRRRGWRSRPATKPSAFPRRLDCLFAFTNFDQLAGLSLTGKSVHWTAQALCDPAARAFFLCLRRVGLCDRAGGGEHDDIVGGRTGPLGSDESKFSAADSRRSLNDRVPVRTRGHHRRARTQL